MFLPGSGPSSLDVWIGDVGGDPMHWTPPGNLPPQGGETDCGYATRDTGRWEMVLPPDGRRNVGGGIGVYGDLHLQESE